VTRTEETASDSFFLAVSLLGLPRSALGAFQTRVDEPSNCGSACRSRRWASSTRPQALPGGSACAVAVIAPTLLDVSVPRAPDEAQANREVALYLGAWRAMNPGARASLLDW